jgi:Fe-S oxidoreductase
VCPTCFCTTTADDLSLDGGAAERWCHWDSCFALSHSYVHGGPVRATLAARHRQWATHKLAWQREQPGAPGCTGCGRCITWCPAGIDIAETVAALRQAEAAGARPEAGGRP